MSRKLVIMLIGKRVSFRNFAFFIVISGLLCVAAEAAAEPQDPNEGQDKGLFDMSIEQLMDVEISIASKKQEKMFEAAAAVYVITNEDIRRSGATCVPEALRMVPGLQVARINSNSWAITARGFQEQFGNKLLVLVDGRTIYNMVFSGVYWDAQDIMVEDIERIEVVRGPGGTLWGANAVNGIINIITKHAKDTQGALVTGGSGNEELGIGAMRYGGKLAKDAYYRLYGKYNNYDDTINTAGNNVGDGWDKTQGGFRIDWDKSQTDLLTLQGDAYYGDIGSSGGRPAAVTVNDILDPFTQVSGENILGRWSHTFSETSDMILQIYHDHYERMDSTSQNTDDTSDVDFQHRFALGERNEITWGLDCRYNTDNFDTQRQAGFQMVRRKTNLYSAFLQDKITLIDKKLALTLGSKFEQDDYSTFEYQPSGRLLWTPNQKNTIWGAISRAVRTPSRADTNSLVDTGIEPTGLRRMIIGNEDFKSEEVLAYELGYRVQPTETFFVDLAGFCNFFDKLRTAELTTSMEMVPFPHILAEMEFDNKMEGEVYGLETSANWNVTKNWKLAGGYSFTRVLLHPDKSSVNMEAEFAEGYTPHHQANLRSYLNLLDNLEFDTALYYSDSLYTMDVPSYLRADARLGWHITKQLELSAVVRNIFDHRHPEFKHLLVDEGEIARSFFVKLTYRF